jgi:gliding motility-associated-like protein
MSQKVYFLLFFILSTCAAYPQCSGSLGTPIIKETFGSGALIIGPPLPAGTTSYGYSESTCPLDGTYSIVNSTTGCFNEWHTLTDHTGDPNGYFMLIDADFKPSDFFVQTVNGLFDGSTYEFAAYIINMFQIPGGINPDITFTIEKPDGTVLKQFDTGPIDWDVNINWTRYGFNFTTPAGVSSIVLRMHNNAPGGQGNDLGLDDITFTPAGPKITISADGNPGDTVKNCFYSDVKLFSTVGNCYVNNAYQWQISADQTTWANIPGAINQAYDFNPPAPGTYFFRVNVAEQGNSGNANCSANSNVFTVIYSNPAINNLSATVCQGTPYTLPSGRIVNGGGIYRDTILNQLGCAGTINIVDLKLKPTASSSTNAVICSGQSYRGHTQSGVYVDTLNAANGCDSLVTVNLTVNGKVSLGPDKVLCPGDSIILAPGAFSSYLWQDGSMAPTFNVKGAGNYWVQVTDSNGCTSADTVAVRLRGCAISKIENTFTPNGDGINDTWKIDILQYYPGSSVIIYTRWGQAVFNSKGYTKAWDGRYKGKELPAGAYYYVINLNNGTAPVSGFVTIIR